ncbi:MAG: FlgD immunoglobulin-like domain containing protein [Candidatus Eisenbacteria bacterium]
MVIVMTLVSNDYSIDLHPSYGCLRRMTYSDEPRVDLRYSYRFAVAGIHEPGGGCPFVSYLTPGGFSRDNNILAQAPAPDGEILDTYLLEGDPTPSDGRYRLHLSEDEADHSLFDAIELTTLDHPRDVRIGVLPGGAVGPYSASALPVACFDSEGRDLLDFVVSSDDRYAVLAAGSQMEVHFPAARGWRGGGAGTRGMPSHKIDPPSGGGRDQAAPGVLDLTDLCYRENATTSILDLPEGLVLEDGIAKMVVTAPVDYWIDSMFLAEFSNEPIVVQQCALLDADHSVDGPCESALADLGEYAALDPGESIELVYEVPFLAPGQIRHFVIRSRGRFGDRPSRSDGLEATPASEAPRASITPNPFAASTSISLSIPEPGGEVETSIYDMAGRLVRSLARREMQPGVQMLHWDGRDDHGEKVASGVYFCRVMGPGFDDQRKLVLIR